MTPADPCSPPMLIVGRRIRDGAQRDVGATRTDRGWQQVWSGYAYTRCVCPAGSPRSVMLHILAHRPRPGRHVGASTVEGVTLPRIGVASEHASEVCLHADDEPVVLLGQGKRVLAAGVICVLALVIVVVQQETELGRLQHLDVTVGVAPGERRSEPGALEDVHRLARAVINRTADGCAPDQPAVAVLDDGRRPDDGLPRQVVDLLAHGSDEVPATSGSDQNLEALVAEQMQQLDHR